jgi:hypothetical protein
VNNLCADIGYLSINYFGEELCGDHVDVVDGEDGTTVVVLADGLGHGVKANILSTLTAKIISTMAVAGLSIEECVQTIAETLPVCAERGVAYSTFTIICLVGNSRAEIIQFDNPPVIVLRDGVHVDYHRTELLIDGKKIYQSSMAVQEGDLFVAMSDGCPGASADRSFNPNWKQEDITGFLEMFAPVGYSAKTLSRILIDEVMKLYGGEPGDDATACIVRIRKREQVNLLIGPPSNWDESDRMMSLFFSKEGKHIICGGTTSSIAARYLGKKVVPGHDFFDKDIPPISHIEGVDLVTEGVITINKVLRYAEDYLEDNEAYRKWCFKKDGASLISQMLFEDATDINFYVGTAINPAHQNSDLPVRYGLKMDLVSQLSDALTRMRKRIKVSYF